MHPDSPSLVLVLRDRLGPSLPSFSPALVLVLVAGVRRRGFVGFPQRFAYFLALVFISAWEVL